MVSLVVALVLSIPITKDCPEDVGLGVVTLGVGSQKVLTGPPGGGEPSFSDPAVLEARRIEKGLVLLIGKSVGTGELRLPLADGGPPRRYRVHVADQTLFCAQPSDEFKALFPCSSTLDFGMQGERIVLSGQASSLAEWEGAKRAVARFGVLLRGRLAADVLTRTVDDANRALQLAGLAKTRFVVAGDTLRLDGEADERDPRLAAVLREWRPKLELALWRPTPEARDGGP